MSGELAELNELLIEKGLTQGESAIAGGALGAVFGMLAGALSILLIVGLVIALLKIIAWWRIFSKAGEKGWKSIIPILDSYTETKIAGTNNFARIIISYILLLISYSVMTSVEQSSPVAVIFAIVSLISIVWYVVERIIRFNGIAKNYGKGTGFVVAWVFFPTITTLILGLGGSQYNKVN